MNISRFKIFIIFILISILGVFVLSKIPLRLNPNNELSSINISYSLPKASSYNLERNVTSKIEAGLSTLKGLKKINSKSSLGQGYITLLFDKYTDIDVARFETATIVRQLFEELPENISYPTIRVNSPNDEEAKSFLSFSINANESPFSIKKIINTLIEPSIGAIEGIDKTEVSGVSDMEIILTYDNFKLKILEISKVEIIEALKNVFKREFLGKVYYKEDYIALSVRANNDSIDWNIPIKKIGNKIIYLDQLVKIKKGEKETQNYYRIDGKNAIILNIFAEKKANTLVLADKVKSIINELEKKLPNGYTLIKTYDSTDYLQQELNKIYSRSFYTVIALLLFILLINRSIRYTLITILALICNILVSFFFYYVFQIEIQLYSIAGITISLGLIIDNSIIMIDHLKNEHNKKVFLPILASTLTSIGALSIIYFLNDRYKVNLIDFALVIIINLSVSLLIAFYLIPALVEKIDLSPKKQSLLKNKTKQLFLKSYSKIIHVELRFKKLLVLIIILVFGLPIFILPYKLSSNEKWYEKAYNNTIGNSWYAETIRPHIDTYLGGTFRLFNYYVYDKASYNQKEETALYVTASMEKGATIHQMNEVFLDLEKYLANYSDIKQFTTNISSGDYGELEIKFHNNTANSRFPYLLKSRLIRKSLNFGGVDWIIYGVGDGFNNSSNSNGVMDFSVKARGYNYNELNVWADSLKVLLENNSRVQEVLITGSSIASRKMGTEYYFTLDKQKLASSQLSPLSLAEELKALTLSKNNDVSLNIKGEYMPVKLVSESSDSFDLWGIENMFLDSLNNRKTLKNIITITQKPEEESIYKENQEYIRLVEFKYTGNYSNGSDFLNLKLSTLRNRVPLGYKFERNDDQWMSNHNNDINHTYLLLLICGIIYIICAILFESLGQPLIILSIIPISFIGVFITFYIFDFNFDQGGFASFILLSGITVNASILILNSFNELKKEFPHQEKVELYLKSFEKKLFPIVLTILSTILGFIPFVIDGQNEVFWFALGVGTIGGLVFSLIGILFYLPIFILKR